MSARYMSNWDWFDGTQTLLLKLLGELWDYLTRIQLFSNSKVRINALSALGVDPERSTTCLWHAPRTWKQATRNVFSWKNYF